MNDVLFFFLFLLVFFSFYYKYDSYLERQKMISRILSPSRVFKARSFANQCIRNGTRYVAKNGTRALTTVQYSNYNRVQYYQVPQISRCFSLTSEGDQLPFQESISTVTSFENAVNLISVHSVLLILL